MKRAILILAALITLSLSVLAQNETPKVIQGGVLNGKAVSLPKPAYPAEAHEAKAEGAVAVDVVIDENGFVLSAVSQPHDQTVRKNEDGTAAEPREVHPALRTAAETAALGAKFSPTLLSGEPVKVKGRIVYNFVVGTKEPDIVPGGINGGVLNGKATNLPQAEYPAAARAVRASGTVSVQVVVDEEGKVISAQAVSGHPLLRTAAVTAARQAKFSPTTLNGNPVKITGVLTYNFAPAKGEDKPEN
jgi:TonB family protein